MMAYAVANMFITWVSDGEYYKAKAKYLEFTGEGISENLDRAVALALSKVSQEILNNTKR